jgi:toxin ParE1/3/4
VTRRSAGWTVRLTRAAEADFQDILIWTVEHFGARQARVYAMTLMRAISALTSGPSVAGARTREDLGSDVATLHVARARRKGRHLIVFRVRTNRDEHVVEVLRVLHDTMDLPRHLDPPEDEQ